MASEPRTMARPFPPDDVWPPGDIEETVFGFELHQATITNLRWGINEVARIGLWPGLSVPWQALSQIALLGCIRHDGSLYRTYPDLFVYPRPVDPARGSLTIEVDGPPVLIVEVLSEATYEADIDLTRGKGYSYARAGVREYMALDPTSSFLAEGIRAWRLHDGVYQPWDADADGRWHSTTIAVAIGLEGTWATVYTRDGRRILREGEGEGERARLQEELARRDAELARSDEELERLRRLLAKLRGEE